MLKPRALAVVAALTMLSAGAVPAGANQCASGSGLGVARIVEIDTSAGPLYGDITRFTKEDSFLAPKEVVLTFDDGPMPGLTPTILDTLDRYCTKATFFSIGQMAVSYPAGVREILRRGHTLGSHTWSHPLNLSRLNAEKARDQIESGFAAVSLASGGRVAPFFRFPGLSDSQGLLAFLQGRGIATFTVDVVSNDSFIADPSRLIQLTMDRLEARGKGIILFHDIKSSTARALPVILARLKERGYRVVHLRAKRNYMPPAAYTEAVKAMVAAKGKAGARQLVSMFAAGPGDGGDAPSPAAADSRGNPAPVTELAPGPRVRIVSAGNGATASAPGGKSAVVKSGVGARPHRSVRAVPKVVRVAETGWATSVHPRHAGPVAPRRVHVERRRDVRPVARPAQPSYLAPWFW